jgi:dihydroorotase
MKNFKLLFLMLVLMSGSLLAQSYDIVIKGGHIIDPVNNIDKVMDLAIKGGKIAAIKKNIPDAQTKKVINASGLIVSP